MILKENKTIFMIIILISIILLVSSIFDVFNEGQGIFIVLGIYLVLILFSIIIIVKNPFKKTDIKKDIIGEFEKSLEGKLLHFKCPNCNGIFAIKKSKSNNKKAFTLTCPDCGNVGRITSSPSIIVEEIPKDKSENVKFRCKNCNERVSIWAEGADLFDNIQIYSCPYCGKKQSMSNI